MLLRCFGGLIIAKDFWENGDVGSHIIIINFVIVIDVLHCWIRPPGVSPSPVILSLRNNSCRRLRSRRRVLSNFQALFVLVDAPRAEMTATAIVSGVASEAETVPFLGVA